MSDHPPYAKDAARFNQTSKPAIQTIPTENTPGRSRPTRVTRPKSRKTPTDSPALRAQPPPPPPRNRIAGERGRLSADRGVPTVHIGPPDDVPCPNGPVPGGNETR